MEAEVRSSQEDSRALISQDSMAQTSWTSQQQDSPSSLLQTLSSETLEGSVLNLYPQASDGRPLKGLEVPRRRGPSSRRSSDDSQHLRPPTSNILRSSEARESQTSMSQNLLSLSKRPSKSSSVQGSRTSIPRGSQSNLTQHVRTSASQGSRTSIPQDSQSNLTQHVRTSASQGSRTSIPQASQSSEGQESQTAGPQASQSSGSQASQTVGPETGEADDIVEDEENQDSHSSEALGPIHYGNTGSHRHHSGYLADDEGTLGPPRFQVHRRPVCPEMGPLYRMSGPLRPPCQFHIPMPPRPRCHRKPPKAEHFSEFLDFLATGPVLDSLQLVVDEASKKVTQLRTEAGVPLVDVEKGPSRKAKDRRDALEAARRIRGGRPRLYPGFPNNYPSSSSCDSNFYYSPDDCRAPTDSLHRSNLGSIFLSPQWLHRKVSRFERWNPVSRLPPIREKFQLERNLRHILGKKSKDSTCSPKEDFFLWKRSMDPPNLVLSNEQRLAWLSKLLEPVQKKSSEIHRLIEIFSALEKTGRIKTSSPLGTCSPAWKPSPRKVPRPVQIPRTTCIPSPVQKSSPVQMPSPTYMSSATQMPSPVRLPSPSSIPSPPSLPCTADKTSQTEEASLKRASSLKHIPVYQSSAKERGMQTEVSCSTERTSLTEQEVSFIKQELEKELVELLLGTLSSTPSSSSLGLPSYCPTREPFQTLDFLAEHQLFPALQDVVTQAVLKLSLARRRDGLPLFPVMQPETEYGEEQFEDEEEEEEEEKEEEGDANARLWEHITHKAVWYLPDGFSKDDSQMGKSQQGKSKEQRTMFATSMPLPSAALARRRREKAQAEARAVAEAKAQAQEARILSHIRARVRKDSESMRQARYQKLNRTLRRLPSEISFKSHKSLMSHFSLLNPKKEYMLQFLMDQAIKLLLYKYNYEKGLAEKLGFISFSITDTLMDLILGYKKIKGPGIHLSSQIDWPCILDKLEKAEQAALLSPFKKKAGTSTTTSSSSSRHSSRLSSKPSAKPSWSLHRTSLKSSRPSPVSVGSPRTSFPTTSTPSSFLPPSDSPSREFKTLSKDLSLDYSKRPSSKASKVSEIPELYSEEKDEEEEDEEEGEEEEGEEEEGEEEGEEEREEEGEEEEYDEKYEEEEEEEGEEEDEEYEEEEEEEEEEEDETKDKDRIEEKVETTNEDTEEYENYSIMEMETTEEAEQEDSEEYQESNEASEDAEEEMP